MRNRRASSSQAIAPLASSMKNGAASGLLIRTRPAPQTPADGMKEYLARLVKLIPTEVVGLYMVGTGILQQTAKDDKVSWLVWAIICFILVIVVRVFGT